MLTPLFSVTQTADHLVLRIKCPHVRATHLETRIDGPNFRFHCKPYFLSLAFSHDLAPDDADEAEGSAGAPTGAAPRHHANYDIASGFFELTLAKLEPGTHFQDLDILPSLLSGPKQQPVATGASGPVIEELSAENGDKSNEEGSNGGDDDGEDDFDWSWPQTLPSLDTSEDPSDPMVASDAPMSRYGFASHFSKFFVAHQDDVHELLDIPDPDSTTVTERRLAREIAEDTKFDEDHYIGVVIDDAETITELIRYEPWWATLAPSNATIDSSLAKLSIDASPLELTDDEQSRLVRIAQSAAKRPILTSSSDRPTLLLATLDLVATYAFMHRHDMGDPSVEHAWASSRVSATLSCLEQFTSPMHVARSLFRRSLAYPLYRSRPLIRKTLAQDVPKIIQAGGRRAVLRALLELHKSFEASEPHWIWNTLWVEPLVHWVTKTGGWTSAKWEKAWAGVFEDWDAVVEKVEDDIATEWKLEAWEEMASEILRGEYEGDEPVEGEEESSSCEDADSSDGSSSEEEESDDEDEDDVEVIDTRHVVGLDEVNSKPVGDQSLLQLDPSAAAGSDDEREDGVAAGIAAPLISLLTSSPDAQSESPSKPTRPLIQEL
ncbi:SHQ1 protein-domain-containing protein [Catenaria anguillulae PL171]|uniref:SHQ1 protein-domain-containing protein n=1 Tax=Catenaria anguillulae PL171 TaxID=765915 RepID=A0A1Y2HPA2_9FUNG|nr:SHQ1 protein-domain-containing protein [Catenaria anguillulae PL171]